MARHRPAKEGGYQRGEETRLRIIESAVQLFAERGFEGASTRDIASAAGVNAPALQYYFNNKEGVYLACVEQMVSLVCEHLTEPLAHAHHVLRDSGASDDQLIDAYLGVLATYLGFIEETPRSENWRRFMAREKAGLGPPSAFEVWDRDLGQPVTEDTCGLIARLTGDAANDEVTIIRNLALDGQSTAFRMLRNPALKSLGWDSIDHQRMQFIRSVVLGQTRLILQALVAERQ